jgi:excisionase family DNA binding protein
MERYLTISQAADRLGMSERYVRRLISERRIAFHRLGRSVRLAESDVSAFANAGRVEPLTAEGNWHRSREVAA